MDTVGPSYPPLLQESLTHAQRLADVLESLDPRSGRRSAAVWVLGRADEVDCVLQVLIDDWNRRRVGTVQAAQSINSYLAALHRGLALYFGELAPPCCISSLVITASRTSFDSDTAVLPVSSKAKWPSSETTWNDVDEADIMSVRKAPTAPVSVRSRQSSRRPESHTPTARR